MLQKTFYVGAYPSCMLKHVELIHVYSGMNPPVANHAQRDQIPRFAVSAIQVQVMDSQHPLLSVSRVSAEYVTG